jgi:gluconate 5-dehydrogenase
MHDLFSLNGKIALITGSSGGLGFTLARGLAEAGATIILNGRNPDKLDAAVRSLNGEFNVHAKHFDVTDEPQIKEAVQDIEEEIGPLDILLNNAGIQHRGSLETIEKSDYQNVLDINLTGPFLMGKHVAKRMIERQRGKIINICSLMSELGRRTVGPYAAAKGGLKMLTKAMAVDWAQHNIQVNGIGPGYFITDMTQPLADNPEFDAWLKKRTPAGRWGAPAELIGAAVFLASDASNFINGHIIYVDGGVLASL